MHNEFCVKPFDRFALDPATFSVSVQMNRRFFRHPCERTPRHECRHLPKLVIRNIGLFLSGRMEEPMLDADCLIALDGKITAWGKEADLDIDGCHGRDRRAMASRSPPG